MSDPIKPGAVRRHKARYYADKDGPKCERIYEDGTVEIVDVPLYDHAFTPSLAVIDEVVPLPIVVDRPSTILGDFRLTKDGRILPRTPKDPTNGR